MGVTLPVVLRLLGLHCICILNPIMYQVSKSNSAIDCESRGKEN